MEIQDITNALSTEEDVVAASLGITTNQAYHFVIKEMHITVKTGESKGKPYRMVSADFTCEVTHCLTDDVPVESCKGQLVHMQVMNRPEEKDVRILSYIKGLMQACGIQLDDYRSAEVIAGDVVGKEFDGYVKEDKKGYAHIDTRSLRSMNA